MVYLDSRTYTRDLFILLMQFPARRQLDEADMRHQMEESLVLQGRHVENLALGVTATKMAKINGELARLTTREGFGDEGQKVRQITGEFMANDGSQAMIMIMGDVESWAHEPIAEFLESIKGK